MRPARLIFTAGIYMDLHYSILNFLLDMPNYTGFWFVSYSVSVLLLPVSCSEKVHFVLCKPPDAQQVLKFL